METASDSFSYDLSFCNEMEAEVDSFMQTMERFITKTKKGKTLFLLTADHGQSEVDPATTIYLNKAFPRISKMIKTNQSFVKDLLLVLA